MFAHNTLVHHFILCKKYLIQNPRIDNVGGHYAAIVDMVEVGPNTVEQVYLNDLLQQIKNGEIYLPQQEDFIKKLWASRRNKFKYELKLVNKRHLICESDTCMKAGECAQHETAGMFRSEDGGSPNVRLIDGKYLCSEEIPHNMGEIPNINYVKSGVG